MNRYMGILDDMQIFTLRANDTQELADKINAGFIDDKYNVNNVLEYFVIPDVCSGDYIQNKMDELYDRHWNKQ